VCKRLVCGDCRTQVDGTIYCLDHAPAAKKGGSVLKTLALTMGILTVTLAGIYYAMGAWIVMLRTPGIPASIISMIDLFSTTGSILIIGAAALTAILAVAYLATRKKPKRENL